MGFVAAGASIGGTILPIAAKYLIPQVGYAMLYFVAFHLMLTLHLFRFPWTMRIFGFLLLVTLGAANLVN